LQVAQREVVIGGSRRPQLRREQAFDRFAQQRA